MINLKGCKRLHKALHPHAHLLPCFIHVSSPHATGVQPIALTLLGQEECKINHQDDTADSSSLPSAGCACTVNDWLGHETCDQPIERVLVLALLVGTELLQPLHAQADAAQMLAWHNDPLEAPDVGIDGLLDLPETFI